MKKVIPILWPSFVLAIPAEALFFAIFEPMDFSVIGPLGINHAAAYSISFFLFWALGAASSAFTSLLHAPR